jgi:phage major head subunit gpT-like protein
MAVVNTGLSVAAIRGEFFERFAAERTFFQDLTTRIPSTSDTEHHRWLGTVPNMRAWGTGRLAKGVRAESYDIANGKYEASIEVDRDEISDDQLGQIRMRILDLAPRAATHKDYLLSQLLINGATTGYNSYDAVTFWNAAHVRGSSGSQDNDLTSVATADNAVPTTAEMKSAIAAAAAQLMTFKDDVGEPLNLNTASLKIVCSPALWLPAMEALGASMIAQTTNVLQGLAELVVMPWLPDGSVTQTWYLLKTDGIIRPFIFQDRDPIEFGQIAEGSEEEFKREKYLYGVRARYAIAYGEPLRAIRYVFTT